MKYLKVFVLFLVIGLATAGISEAMMGYGPGTGAYGPGFGMMPGGSGMYGGGFMMSNNGSFGMMNGMAGAPVVGEDGTAYLVTQNPTATPDTVPDSSSFQSIITAVNPVGSYVTFALDGIVSRPVVVGNILVATASLPDFTNYTLSGPHMQNQSVLYAIALPLSPESTPAAIALDGHFASVPVIAGDYIYITTTDYGNAMLGPGTFSMFGNYDFNSGGTAKTYLYIFSSKDASLVSKTEIQ